jgi:threonine dehydratase
LTALSDGSDFDLRDVADTAALIAPYIRATPIRAYRGDELDERVESRTEVVLKLELFQATGSFKARGVFSVMCRLSREELRRGVTTVSSGNHAVALAYAAKTYGTSAKVVMLASANRLRVDLARGYGAEVLLEETGQKAYARAEKIAKEEGRVFVHPFEGRNTSLGTATLGAEFMKQASKLDAVIVAIGGGGLASGLSAAIKMINPTCSVFGVEPTGAATMYQSFASSAPQRADAISTIADSLAPPMVLPYSFGLCRLHIERIVLVGDDQMCDAMSVLFHRAKLAVEPAGAASLAALLGPLREELAGRRVGVVVCGSNIDIGTFAKYTLRGSTRGSTRPSR